MTLNTRWFAVATVLGLAATAAGNLANAQSPEAAVLRAGPPELVTVVSDELVQAGYRVRSIDTADLCDAEQLAGDQVDLLALTDAAALPARSIEPIVAFLGAGGDIIALNAPLWQRILLQDGDEWVERNEYSRRRGPGLLEHALFDFGPGSLDGWRRTTNDPATETLHETIADESVPEGGRALHVVVSKLTNWDTFVSPALEGPFPPGDTLTVFFARGGPRTTELAIEWAERDGSRWIATVPLTHDWQTYVLEPADFRYWESVPGRARGAFNPENAAQMSVGLAFTHTRIPGDYHEYWVGPFGTAPRTPDHEKLLTSFKLPTLDTLSPGYKLFPVTEAKSLRVPDDLQDLLTIAPSSLPGAMRSPHPRPQAGGLQKGRAWRWMPLLEAYAEGQDREPPSPVDWRGTPVTLLVHADGPYKGGVWASFGIGDWDWYRSRAARDCIGHVARRMRRGLFLVDGGADHYTYFDGQEMTVGVRVVNLGDESADVRAVVKLGEDSGGEESWILNLPSGGDLTVSNAFRPVPWVAADESGQRRCVVTTELHARDEVIDRAIHEAHLWEPKPEKSFITVEDGEFMLDGTRWRAHGVNYMPSSGIGIEDWDYFEHWIGARAYGPEVIERDLQRIKSLGMNAVSIFIHHESLEAQNLLDLLRRLDAHGMKANLSLRPGTPMDFEWDKMRELLEYYRIREHDSVFALDLAWEPMFRDHDARKRWDPRWREWITERYGSIANAESDWGYEAPRDEAGAITNPLGEHTVQDGPWRAMVAAYRRFLDTLLYEKYSQARRLVRGIDPNHLVSFRMAEAGNPTFRWEKAIPYDFAYLAAAVDVLEPEAYGRIGDWDRVKPGWFEYEYARWAAPEMPMMWAEAGVSAWVESKMTAPADRLQFQADYYTHLYRMFINSGADGVFFWWYPGGYRTNERSDYGIIEPDGSDRPVTRVIREHAASFLDGPPARPVDHWLEFDRDRHPDGIAGIYDEVGDAFWQAIESGGTPGLKTAGTGSDSATCPLTAVGNSSYTGTNPPKYLDGFFDAVKVRDANGERVVVESGGSVEVPSDGPVIARIEIANLGEAAWVAPGLGQEAGSVYLLADWDGDDAMSPTPEQRIPMPRPVPRLGTVALDNAVLSKDALRGTATVTLRLLALDRTVFGPPFIFTVRPK